ncbi:UxaA family hydrolase [Phaeovulum sp.]|uniref:UxaA family hydrolase n=1 Tax=Phaeovulum sp. TaxID=2934796 RepID=UPI00273105B8|nr:altronate dehydratase family protein [Phaeovulum sp.]MDP1668396.1 altronate dehydratase family protein [Phaeovulum sp.]MDZ4120109.1 altronate dehydratase family protein [Phaeovulum sp.]
MKPDHILLSPEDDVAIALADLPIGAAVAGVVLTTAVPRGHKIARHAIAAGAAVRRYGQIIGQASRNIAPGEHVHVQNLAMSLHALEHDFGADLRALPAPSESRSFQGYRRADGQAGTRNYLGVLTSVNCSGSVARFIAEAAEQTDWFRALKNVDGIVPIAHSSGCGMAGDNEGYQTLMRTLQGYARNPNFAGILLVGLGCEVMQIPALIGKARLRADGQFHHMTIQEQGGTRRSVERGVEALRALAEVAETCRREPIPVSELVIGMQCGGSDGYSGITANPALGVASDLLVAHGGTTILSETSEIYGAEHLLTRRAISPHIGEQLLERIRWWEDYTARNKGEMNNNPSPGNKRGGLTTILEKSLGAVAKGGSAPLMGVYLFAEPITAKGFVFMDSPGYDPCSVTGQVASGANLIVFTTGRGSVSGYKPVPCIKIATNSEMFRRMEEDMDLNTGDILEGVTLEEKGREMFEQFIRVASGEVTKSEGLGFGGAEFVPWQIGAVM